MHIYLVRHGETQLNLKKAYYGKLDTGLTDAGHRQAKAVGEMLKEIVFDVAYVSSRCRTQQTAADILACGKLPGPDPICLPGLDEIDFGCFEGLSLPEILEKYPTQYDAWSRDWLDSAPQGGETFRAFYERVGDAFGEIMRQTAGLPGIQAECVLPRETESSAAEKNVLICAHNGSLRVLLARMCEMGPAYIWHYYFDQGAWSRVDFAYDNFTIRRINSTQPATRKDIYE